MLKAGGGAAKAFGGLALGGGAAATLANKGSGEAPVTMQQLPARAPPPK